jgi:acetyltransferase-like isoleucine patch superfamily enzyme
MEMTKIGKGTTLKGVKIIGEGDLIIGNNCKFGKNIIINVKKRFVLGDRSIIGDDFEISGVDIEIDKEFWSGRQCAIGGGSCMEKRSKLRIGYWGHLGDFSFINTARPVTIGDEVGLGQDTRIYTHGTYQNWFKGFPVDFGPITIEDRVWCPKAMIMPNVTIGHDTVVGAGAVVTKSLPAGCLAVGTPAKVIRENCYPKVLTKEQHQQMLKDFITHFKTNIRPAKIELVGNRIFIGKYGTLFHMEDMKIDGQVTALTEKFKNELRRFGCRFQYYAKDGRYVPW